MADVIPPTPPKPPVAPAPKGGTSSGASGFAIGAVAGSIALGIGLALLRPQRSIGTIIAGVTVEEAGRDDLEITRHPVEIGAAITDNAFKRPAEIILRCGWSGTFHLPGYLEAVYAALLDLQYSRIPFTVTTGKRTYVNMLISSIAVTTDKETENVLLATIACRQVLLVRTLVTSVAPRAQQAQPQTTAPTEQTGQQQPVAKPNVSLLKQGANALGITPGTNTGTANGPG